MLGPGPRKGRGATSATRILASLLVLGAVAGGVVLLSHNAPGPGGGDRAGGSGALDGNATEAPSGAGSGTPRVDEVAVPPQEQPDPSNRTGVPGPAGSSGAGNASHAVAFSQRWRNLEPVSDVGEWGLHDLVAAPDGGRFYIVGANGTPTGRDGTRGLVAAVDAREGRPSWTRTVSGPGNQTAALRALSLGPSGHLLVAVGATRANETEMLAVGLNATTGETVWKRTPAEGSARDVVVTPDGRHAVSTGFRGHDHLTVAFDAANGLTTWSAEAYPDRPEASSGEAIASDPVGEHVVATGDHLVGEIGTVAYDVEDGHRRWRAALSEPGDSAATGVDVDVSPDGEVAAVAGELRSRETGNDWVAAAYATGDGERAWFDRYDGPGGGDDEAQAVAIAPDGRTVFVTGVVSTAQTGKDLVTTAYDAANGSVLWMRHEGPDPNGYSADLETDPLGRAVYVTGSAWNASAGSEPGLVTVAHEPGDGRVLAEAGFDVSPEDRSEQGPTDLLLGPTGSWLVVAGETRRGESPFLVGYDVTVNETE